MSRLRKDRKQLPKIYRLKKKTGKIKKPEVKQEPHPSTRIVVRNISFKASENDLKKFFSPFGEINEINLLKRTDGSLVGCGFVQFKKEEDASKAIFQTNKKEFLGRTLACSWAIPKLRYYEQINLNSNFTQIKEKEKLNSELIHVDSGEVERNDVNDKNETKVVHKNNEFKRKLPYKLTAEERKLQKLARNKKESRLIIRNIPFKATEEDIKTFFKDFGVIEDIKVPCKPNGKKLGCCFIQFEDKKNAEKAIKEANLKEFLDRTIVIDWAIPKDRFDQLKAETSDTKIKEEDCEIEKDEINDEKSLPNSGLDDTSIKQEESSNDDQNETDEKYSDEDDESEDVNDNNETPESIETKPMAKKFSNDIVEEKTVFFKNVPFRATNEDLKKSVEQYGPIYYALICVDKLTEHSKGTAFVKFKNTEDAQKCLQAGTELQILGQVLDPHPALSRKQLDFKTNEKKHKSKDSRNLYLIREGVILAGSPASNNVSAADMAKRLKIEQWKSQILKNLNMFVSRVRLVVHNLPPSFNDSQFQKLIHKYVQKDGVVTETRVMKNDRGIGTSKEYGFVSFTNHEDALRTLRILNNNPNVFSVHKRPIVSFSIENRIMVNAKKNRLLKSKRCNPNCKEYVPKKIEKDENQTLNEKRNKSKGNFKQGQSNNVINSKTDLVKSEKDRRINNKSPKQMHDSKNSKRKIITGKNHKQGPPNKKKKSV